MKQICQRKHLITVIRKKYIFEVEMSFTKFRSFFFKASVSGNILGFFFVFTNSLHLFCLPPTVFPATLRPTLANICKGTFPAPLGLWLGLALVFVFAVTFWGCGLVLFRSFSFGEFFLTDLLEGALSDFQKHSKESPVLFFMFNVLF